ncbi:tail fiber domain-containing protein [Klebsiella variicola]|uniref:tail fiber domain-containing protein n=2 Tax=Klebsiella/Raoultella group TaxID=2890311 RepID=UPI00164C9A31|nr:MULTISPECIES: tail fiber domain-containing protein [Klebsiella]HBQ3201989.1 tail fiber domain-containing protein [Klebsiella variicola subsp. variicola]HBS5700679.1 tail fiber domain-containing protein [Klebsiella aerogenes]HDT6090410.1 tail fiber domain-containing protein [Raoultella ornithinolytica]MBC4922495.1 tail fiber domain-containing protein [Klebsiella variicola]HCQ8366828.1 tail fiber domain-containing protein [Klebsiella oxytoca]
MAMYEVGTVTGAANQTKVTGISTKWSETALGIQEGSILVIYRNGSADLYAIKSVNNDTQLTLTRNITTAFSGAKYGIITSETASTSSFANQLASAFTLWRNVVQGWSTALTGSGDITMTDPLTGASVTVPAISGMAKASDLAALSNSLKDAAKTTAANTWTQAQTWNAASTFKNNLTVSGTFTVNGNLNGKQLAGGHIELTEATPYIDFHHGNSTTDYTHRIITEDGALAVYPGLRIRGGLGIYGVATQYGDLYGNAFIGRLNTDPTANVGDVLQAPRFTSRFSSRGADTNVDGGQAAMWFEEQVGTNHRLILSVGGFSQPIQYWQFLADGNIYGSQRGSVQFLGTSDARLKHDITPTDGQQSVDRIKALELVTFVYNDDEQNRVRRGIIAQQAEEVDEQYVKHVNISYLDGNKQVNSERLQLDNNVIMMDTLAAVKVLIKRVEALENKINSSEGSDAIYTNQNTFDTGVAMSSEQLN